MVSLIAEAFKGLMDSQPHILLGAMANNTISLHSLKPKIKPDAHNILPIVCWLLPNQTPEACGV